MMKWSQIRKAYYIHSSLSSTKLTDQEALVAFGQLLTSVLGPPQRPLTPSNVLTDD
jgi:hypothetical protein